jgi:hypothetical protein
MREANHLPPTSTKIKNGGSIPPLPHTSSRHSAELTEHRDKLTFAFAIFTGRGFIPGLWVTSYKSIARSFGVVVAAALWEKKECDALQLMTCCNQCTPYSPYLG